MVNGEHEAPKAGIMNSGVYDILKFCALILFPALGTLYFTVAQIWGLPNAEEVVGTIVAIDAFLGVVIGVSKTQYDKSDADVQGVVVVENQPEGRVVTGLHLDMVPEELDPGKKVVVKVKPPEGGVV